MKILFLTVNKNDATSYYRAAGIANDLERKIHGTIDVYDFEYLRLKWSDLIVYDVVMIQRPQDQDALNLAEYIKTIGVPLWMDFDDDLLNIHWQHNMADVYGAKVETIKKIVGLADLLTVSTEGILSSFGALCPRTIVVPNSISESRLRGTYEQTETILWRGGGSHLSDLYYYATELQKLLNEGHPIKFMGENPFFLQKYSLLLRRDTVQYLHYIKKLRPKLFIVPLIDHQFNRAKSNIAWLEATSAGAVCLATDLPEFNRPGIINFSNPRNFYNVFKKAVKDYYLEAYHAESLAFIRENLTTEKVNELRVMAINEIV
jgi:hypothetical protein